MRAPSITGRHQANSLCIKCEVRLLRKTKSRRVARKRSLSPASSHSSHRMEAAFYHLLSYNITDFRIAVTNNRCDQNFTALCAAWKGKRSVIDIPSRQLRTLSFSLRTLSLSLCMQKLINDNYNANTSPSTRVQCCGYFSCHVGTVPCVGIAGGSDCICRRDTMHAITSL